MWEDLFLCNCLRPDNDPDDDDDNVTEHRKVRRDTALRDGECQDRFIELGSAVRGKNGISEGWTICCNFPSFPPGEREKVGHAGSEEGRKENCSKQWDFD